MPFSIKKKEVIKMIQILTKIIALNPSSILLAIGGIGFLLGITGAGMILGLGVLLQVGWLARYFI